MKACLAKKIGEHLRLPPFLLIVYPVIIVISFITSPPSPPFYFFSPKIKCKAFSLTFLCICISSKFHYINWWYGLKTCWFWDENLSMHFQLDLTCILLEKLKHAQQKIRSQKLFRIFFFFCTLHFTTKHKNPFYYTFIFFKPK